MTTRTQEYESLLEAIEDDPGMTQLATLPCLCGVEMGYHLLDVADGKTESDCPLAQALVSEANEMQLMVDSATTSSTTLTSTTFAPMTTSTAATTSVVYVNDTPRTAANTYTIRILKPNEVRRSVPDDVHSD